MTVTEYAVRRSNSDVVHTCDSREQADRLAEALSGYGPVAEVLQREVSPWVPVQPDSGVRGLLEAWAARTGGVWVIENVPGAPLNNPVRLCGSSFGLRVRRHRLFESNAPLMQLPCRHAEQGTPVGVYGDHADRAGGWTRPSGTSRGVKATSVADAQDALGIDWMSSWDDLADAVPPAYTEFIGEQLISVALSSSGSGVTTQ